MAGEEKLGGAFIDLTAPPGEFIKDLKKAKFSLFEFAADATGLTDRIANAVSTIGLGLTGLITAPFVALSAATTVAGADVQRLQVRFSRAFGEMSDDIRQWAREVADVLRLSSFNLRSALTDFQALFISMGLGVDIASNLSRRLVLLGLDLASVRKASPVEIFGALQSAMQGNTSAVRALGADISVAALEHIALAKGVTTSIDALSTEEKVLLRVDAIMEAFSAEVGQAGIKANQFAGITLSLGEIVKDVGRAIGGIMIPFMSVLKFALLQAAFALRFLTEQMNRLPEPIKFVIVGLGALLALLGPLILLSGGLLFLYLRLAAAFGVTKLAMIPLNALMTAFAGVTTVSAAATAVWTQVMIAANIALGFFIAKLQFLLVLTGIGILVLLAAFAAFKLFASKDQADRLAEINKELEDMEFGLEGINEELTRAGGGFRRLGSIAIAAFQKMKLSPPDVLPGGTPTPFSKQFDFGLEAVAPLRPPVSTRDMGLIEAMITDPSLMTEGFESMMEDVSRILRDTVKAIKLTFSFGPAALGIGGPPGPLSPSFAPIGPSGVGADGDVVSAINALRGDMADYAKSVDGAIAEAAVVA